MVGYGLMWYREKRGALPVIDRVIQVIAKQKAKIRRRSPGPYETEQTAVVVQESNKPDDTGISTVVTQAGTET